MDRFGAVRLVELNQPGRLCAVASFGERYFRAHVGQHLAEEHFPRFACFAVVDRSGVASLRSSRGLLLCEPLVTPSRVVRGIRTADYPAEESRSLLFVLGVFAAYGASAVSKGQH
jgi:hypothetical protein